MFTTARSGIWVGLLVTSLRDSKRLSTELRGLSKHFWVICDSYFIENRTRFSRERSVLSSITIYSLATIWTTAMYISFFHFEVRVASGDSRVVIFARIRIDNLPVHLGYNGTCNGSRVSLQLLKNYKDVNGHEESVSWL